MRRIGIVLVVFFTFFISVQAAEMYGCLDQNGNRIITDKPQDGMTNCAVYGSDEDAMQGKNIQKGMSKNRGDNSQCDSVADTMNSARTYLNQAAKRKTSELEKGRDDVSRAVEYLSEAETMSSDCQCPRLSDEISNAVQYARQAINESSVTQFSDSLTRALRAFNNSSEAYKRCR